MALGDDIKSAVDSVRDALGLDCTLNGTTALGKCSYAEADPGMARSVLGSDYDDEIDMPWVMIEVPAAITVKEGDKITVDLTSLDYIVRRVEITQAGGVKIAQRCVCTGQLVEA